ncbi:MAG: hypothetical protein ACLFV0_11200 [Nitriliruptoraceae bacterium]
MPSTPNFGWTTPADTDPVKDGAAAIRSLADDIDAELADGYVTSDDVTAIVKLTQAAYDALDPADPDTLYVIVEA